MAIEIKITIDDTDEKILKDNLVDIDSWFQNAAVGKINNCWKRIQNTWTTALINDESFTDPIPSSKADFVTLVTGRSDYKDAATKAAEANSLLD
tara:strand:- start:156 stop:437 length:282 start_codon:yes stop_codon:yes gene_type:complete